MQGPFMQSVMHTRGNQTWYISSGSRTLDFFDTRWLHLQVSGPLSVWRLHGSCCLCLCLCVFFFQPSYAEKAQSQTLCSAAARHYWNTCLPLTRAPADRQQLQGPLETILSALCCTGAQQTKVLILHKAGLRCDRNILLIIDIRCVKMFCVVCI